VASTTVVVAPAMPLGATMSMFPPDPIQTTCPNCQQTVLTLTTHELGMMAWLIAFVLIIFGFVLIYCVPVADPGGVQGVQTPALLFRCPFLKRTYFENMLRFLAEQGAS